VSSLTTIISTVIGALTSHQFSAMAALWTGVILHSSHNLFIQSIFSPLTMDTGNTKYFIGEFGVVLPVVCMFFAVLFWKKRSELINADEITFSAFDSFKIR
jgi:branched-subunit amino acid ABC-type transport system permease component